MEQQHFHARTMIKNKLCRAINKIITALALALSLGAHGKTICETGASPFNPLVSASSGIGGTGAEIAQSGIGGTGIGNDNGSLGDNGSIFVANGKMTRDGGIGGTGEKMTEDGGIGGTGIFGMITGFASICVNGIEIHYTANTPVTMDGSPSTLKDLATGQIVAVRAGGFGNALTAQHIAIMHAAVGPITNIDHLSREIQVLNQPVQLLPNDNMEILHTGGWVRVSGHRLANGTIIASHIHPTQPLGESKINGRITQISLGELVVDGTRIEFDPQSLPTDITEGTEISIKGHWDGTNMHAQTLQIDPTRHNLGDVEHIILEGYVHDINEQTFRLNNQHIKIKHDAEMTGITDEKPQLNQRIQISGRLAADDHVIADKIELKHTPYMHDIDIIRFENNDHHSNDAEKDIKENNEGTSGKTKFRENMQNRNPEIEADSDPEQSANSSKDYDADKKGQPENESERSNIPVQDNERSDEQKDFGSSEKSINLNDNENNFDDLDHLGREHESNLADALQDLDQEFDQDLIKDHDLEQNLFEDHDLNLHHEEIIERDFDMDFDRDFDYDLDRDFDNDFDRDFDRDFDYDLDRDFVR